MSFVWVVTVIEEYDIYKQWIFLTKAEAETIYHKELVDHFKYAAEDSNMTPGEYQDSQQWWDDDCRIKVNIKKSTYSVR